MGAKVPPANPASPELQGWIRDLTRSGIAVTHVGEPTPLKRAFWLSKLEPLGSVLDGLTVCFVYAAGNTELWMVRERVSGHDVLVVDDDEQVVGWAAVRERGAFDKRTAEDATTTFPITGSVSGLERGVS